MSDRNIKLLEVYSLDEILEALDLEDIDVLAILEEQGYLDKLSIPEPL